MTWPKVEEINANTNAARDEIKGNTDTAKNEIKTYTAEEIAAAIQTLQAATESARDMILAGMPTGGGLTSCIKKIQRGTGVMSSRSGSMEIALSGFSDLGKMAVVLDSYHDYDEDVGCRVGALTETKLTIEGSDNHGFYFSYQVIETY